MSNSSKSGCWSLAEARLRLPAEGTNPNARRLARTKAGTILADSGIQDSVGRPANSVVLSHPSGASPTSPALRANLYPEVTDLICRLPLPTLFYRLEAVHLGDLLRISVRPGTKVTVPSDFQGSEQAHGTPQEPRGFTEATSLSPAEPIPGSPLLKQKRQLYSGLIQTSPSSVALPPWAPPRKRVPKSVTVFGNVNPIPFRRTAQWSANRWSIRPRLRID